MPSLELFADQSEGYRAEVLPGGVPRLAIEAAATFGWRRWVGDGGEVLGLDRFGASAPGKVVAAQLGFTVEAGGGACAGDGEEVRWKTGDENRCMRASRTTDAHPCSAG